MNSVEDQTEIVEGTFGRMKEVADFLPSPEQLVLKEEKTVKITLALDKTTLDFFKSKAEELGAPYQRMIRNLLNEYVTRQKLGE